MNIQINAEYRLVGDSNQVTVQKYAGTSEKKGAIWTAVSYHGNVKQAIESLYQRMIRECDASTLAELRETAESLSEMLRNAWTVANEVEIKGSLTTAE